MVIYVSPAESNGGILQFSVALTKETAAITQCMLFLPDTVNEKHFSDIKENVIRYRKIKTLNSKNIKIYNIAKQILDLSPEIVIFAEDSILMQQLCRVISKNGVKTAMTVHDIHHHPYRKMGFRSIAVDVIRRIMTKRTVKVCSKIILLSKNSEKAFRNEYKVNNTVVFRLPAHVPLVQPEQVGELPADYKNYFLFFGRIDEYKGIGRLCRAYSHLPEHCKEKNELVIAGNGTLSEEEIALIRADKHIRLINRFITDGEMIWLFINSQAVVLPYIEASQSGVLPIAYKYNKPVVVSDLEGLTENVEDGKTGYVFSTEDDLTAILLNINNTKNMDSEIADYYAKNYIWKYGIEKLLSDIEANTKTGEPHERKTKW